MKERMIDLLLKEPIGRIVACNIFAALEENLIKRELLKTFLENCLQAFTEVTVLTTEDLIGQFEDVARGDRPISNRRQFLFACTKRTTAMTEDSEFSTVMEIGTLNGYLISDSALADGHASFVSNPDPTDPMLRDAIDLLNGRTDIYRSNAYLGGNPNRPLFWITPSEMLLAERRDNSLENLGDAIRDLLGLIRYEDSIPLVELRIPGNRLRCQKHARPTFADAGTHRRFRIRPDTSRARQRSGWGCTVHLRLFANGNTNINGASERVVDPAALNADLDVEFEFAGFTETTRGNTIEDDDAAFAERVCYGINLSELKDFFEDLLS